MFWNNNVDAIVASLNRTVSKLNALAEKQQIKHERTMEKISALQADCDICKGEGARATRIANKITELVK